MIGDLFDQLDATKLDVLTLALAELDDPLIDELRLASVRPRRPLEFS